MNVFDHNLRINDQARGISFDLQQSFPGFSSLSSIRKIVIDAVYKNKVRKIILITSKWLPPHVTRFPIAKALSFGELYEILNKELKSRLTKAELQDVIAEHINEYGESPPADLYKTRKDSFHPQEYPNWILKDNGRNTITLSATG